MKLYQSWIKYYDNVCQKIKSGKFFSFSMLTDQKIFFPSGNWQNIFPYFSRLRRNPAYVPVDNSGLKALGLLWAFKESDGVLCFRSFAMIAVKTLQSYSSFNPVMSPLHGGVAGFTSFLTWMNFFLHFARLRASSFRNPIPLFPSSTCLLHVLRGYD